MSELSISVILETKSSPVSISSLSAYQLHHLVFSLLPFSCNFSLKLAQILPTEENFLLCFRQFVSSSAEFMAVRLFLSVCVDGQIYVFLVGTYLTSHTLWTRVSQPWREGSLLALILICQQISQISSACMVEGVLFSEINWRGLKRTT